MGKTDKYSFLPRTKSFPREAPSPPTEGWWRDPFEGDGPGAQRYHDGARWTQYVSLRAMRNWPDIIEDPPHESGS
jgi:hypothetical protein